MSEDDGPTRDELAALPTDELRELLSATRDPTVAGRAIRALPVSPAASQETTIDDVARAVERFDDPPYYAVAEYCRRVEQPAMLTAHPALLGSALWEGPIHDDNYVHEVTTPIDALGSRDDPAAGTFVDDLVAALDREPQGHEGATSLLETIRRVQFAESEIERDEYGAPETPLTADTVPLSAHADSVAEHADSIAAVLARQYDPGLAQTSETARAALVVLHGIAATDPGTVADQRVLEQVVRALRELSPRNRAFPAARSVLVSVAEARPDAVAPHVDPVVASVAAGLRAADADTESGPDPRETATKRLVLVADLLATHPEETVEAADWARLRSAFGHAGPATRDAGGALLGAAAEIEEPLARALLLELVAVAARESPETFAAHRDRIEALAREVLADDGRERAPGRASAERRIADAVDAVQWATED